MQPSAAPLGCSTQTFAAYDTSNPLRGNANPYFGMPVSPLPTALVFAGSSADPRSMHWPFPQRFYTGENT